MANHVPLGVRPAHTPALPNGQVAYARWPRASVPLRMELHEPNRKHSEVQLRDMGS